MDLKQFASALGQISDEKGISPEKVLETIEIALAAAYKKEYGEKGQIVKAKFNPETGDVKFSQVKIVVDESMLKPEGEEDEEVSIEHEVGEDKKIRFNAERHIMLDEAKKTKKDVTVGDELEFPLETRENFGRIAAQTAKQVIIQRIREAEREAVWDEYKDKEGELVKVTANIVNEGEWCKVIPGGVDYFYPLSPITEFDDFTIKIKDIKQSIYFITTPKCSAERNISTG